jgi:hypothetical protein
MSNDALIGELDRLRETYSQRQKTTNNLLTTLKGTTSALGKANRVLREYADLNPNTNDIARAQQSFSAGGLREEAIDPLLPILRRETKTLTSLAGALKDAVAALRAESVDVVKLGHAYAALQSAKVQDATLTALLPDIGQELEQAQYALGDTFGHALRAALAEQGIAIGGRPPRFEIGRFELVANFVNRAAVLYYGKDVVVKRVPLSVEAVIKVYTREAKAIMGRNEDGARWVEQFYQAWENARSRRRTSDNRANIVECYFEQVLLRQPKNFRSAPGKSGFVDYSRAQFAYDFFQFANAKPPIIYKGMKIFGHGATKSQADSVEKSIWIVEGDSPYVGRYIADVVFDRDE